MKRWIAISAASAVAAMLLSAAAASAQECVGAGGACQPLIEARCLDRLGAGAALGAGALSANPSLSQECRDQLDAYRGCLADYATRCGDGAAAAQPSALNAWKTVRDSDDAAALEAFALAYPASPLSNVAANRAAQLRADAERALRDREAAAVWAETERLDDPDAYEKFARAHPYSAFAEEAASRAAAIRERRRRDAAEAEAAAVWAEIEALNDAEPLEKFLAAFAETKFAERARARLAALRASATPAPALSAPSQPPAGAAEIEAAEEAQRALYRDVQRELNRLGIGVGAADGIWGPRSEAGLRRYRQLSGVSGADAPTAADLAAMRSRKAPFAAAAASAGSSDRNRSAASGFELFARTERAREDDAIIVDSVVFHEFLSDRSREFLREKFAECKTLVTCSFAWAKDCRSDCGVYVRTSRAEGLNKSRRENLRYCELKTKRDCAVFGYKEL